MGWIGTHWRKWLLTRETWNVSFRSKERALVPNETWSTMWIFLFFFSASQLRVSQQEPGYDTCDQDDKGCLLVFKHVLFHPESPWWLQRFSHIPQLMACRWLPKHLHHCTRTIGVYVLEPLWTAMTITFSWVLPQTWDSHLRKRILYPLVIKNGQTLPWEINYSIPIWMPNQ